MLELRRFPPSPSATPPLHAMKHVFEARLSRREFVGVVAATIAATWIAGSAGGELGAAGVLNRSQLRDLDAITALIIPADDIGGAHEARVVDFIDRALGSFAADQRSLFDSGLADLNARVAHLQPGASSFADLPADEGIALLRQLEEEGSVFFEAVRVATITGYLADPSYGGNAGKVGWEAIGFEDRPAWTAPFGWYDDAAHAQ